MSCFKDLDSGSTPESYDASWWKVTSHTGSQMIRVDLYQTDTCSILRKLPDVDVDPLETLSREG